MQPKRFENEVMKLYFQKTKYKSFQRQLNIYNFLKFHHGPLKGKKKLHIEFIFSVLKMRPM